VRARDPARAALSSAWPKANRVHNHHPSRSYMLPSRFMRHDPKTPSLPLPADWVFIPFVRCYNEMMAARDTGAILAVAGRLDSPF
jgi:hypothetical protein